MVCETSGYCTWRARGNRNQRGRKTTLLKTHMKPQKWRFGRWFPFSKGVIFRIHVSFQGGTRGPKKIELKTCGSQNRKSCLLMVSEIKVNSHPWCNMLEHVWVPHHKRRQTWLGKDHVLLLLHKTPVFLGGGVFQLPLQKVAGHHEILAKRYMVSNGFFGRLRGTRNWPCQQPGLSWIFLGKFPKNYLQGL